VGKSEPALLPLAESIADGNPIDWNAVVDGADADEQGIIRQLRIVANLAVLHRSLPDPSLSATARRSHPLPSIGNWAHLALTERLGSGSFGEVYRAWDRRLEREIALKLLRPGVTETRPGDPESSRIAEEGRLLARVRHPNVITVHGVEVHDGRVGLCMELIRGTTLEESLQRRGPFSAREASLIGIDLCRALAAIHGAGLIHRDVKAQNVMREDGGRIVLMDLGTGRETRGGAGSDLTGTPLYLAPEIFEGASANESTDLYSLGMLLYHLVTGTFPVRAANLNELRDAHAAGSGVRLRDARPDLPTAFVRVVDRAIAVDSRRRYKSAGELESDLIEALDAPHAATPSAVPASSGTASMRTIAARSIVAAAVVIAAGALLWPAIKTRFAPPPPIASRDTVLVAEVANTTGDPLFDGTLTKALVVQLQQSPYLNALGAESVDAGLRMMGRAPGTPVTGAVARELCQRQRIKAMIAGAISSINGRYLVTVEAQDCQTSEPLARETADAASRDGALSALGAAVVALRGKLGESLSSIQRFNVPIEDATTKSLDALKAYTVGMETRTKVGDVEAIPMFNHALELDPNFALAEARLAAIYTNLREHAQAQAHMKRAFELSPRVSERERLDIKAAYHAEITGRNDEVEGAYRLWISLYPMDWVPHINLAAALLRTGRYDEAVREAEAAQKLDRDQVFSYEQLGDIYLSMGRFDECVRVLQDARAKGFDTSFLRSIAYQVAFVSGDSATMTRELSAAGKRSEDYLIVAAASEAAAFNGDFAAGRNLSAQAVSMAIAGRMTDVAGALIAQDAVTAAVVDDDNYARKAIDRALGISRGTDALWAGSLAAALSGNSRLAGQLAEEFSRVTPPTIEATTVMRPILDAAIAVTQRDYQRTIDLLQPATTYERIGDFWPAYLRGVACLGLKKPADAAGQFRAVLSHRGDRPTSVLFPLARLQLARALRASGDTAAAREAIGQFIKGWSAAPRTQPILAAALREQSTLMR
jgi:eukaryotic-like serine/threonine-protein kinase